MMSRFEAEPRATKPPQFEAWLAELEEIADSEGVDLLCVAWLYSPVEPCDYLGRLPGLMQELLARARWADACAGRRDLRRSVS
jgi:hypothetical protein